VRGKMMIQNVLTACDYENGYTKALIDVKNWFKKHSISMNYYKMYNQKNIEMLLNAICKGAYVFQQYGEDTEMTFEQNKNRVSKVFITQRKEWKEED
jgi:hypothetical protein